MSIYDPAEEHLRNWPLFKAKLAEKKGRAFKMQGAEIAALQATHAEARAESLEACMESDAQHRAEVERLKAALWEKSAENARLRQRVEEQDQLLLSRETVESTPEGR